MSLLTSAHGVSVHVTTPYMASPYMASPYILSLFKVNNNTTQLAAKCNEQNLVHVQMMETPKSIIMKIPSVKFLKTNSNNTLKQFNLMFMIPTINIVHGN